MVYNISLFIVSFLMLALAAHWVVGGLSFLARFFKWREFVLVYFVLVLGAMIPNLSIGIFSTMRNVPNLFLGDVLGNSLITITLIIGSAAIISGGIYANSRVVQQSSFFLILTALMPLLLIMDGELSRGDGVVLLSLFFIYSAWLFSKRKLFEGTYENDKGKIKRPVISFLKNAGGIILGIPLLVLAGNFIVQCSTFFADSFNLEIAMFGVLFVAIGTSLPELFFIIAAARKKNNWLVLGAAIGDVIVLPTLGLGLISIITPIKITDFSNFYPLFLFLIISSILFLFFIKSGKRITSKEGIILLIIYFLFVGGELVSRIF